MRTGHKADESRHVQHHCGAIREVLACNKMEIDEKKEGWDPQVPDPLARWPANDVVWMACGCVIIM